MCREAYPASFNFEGTKFDYAAWDNARKEKFSEWAANMPSGKLDTIVWMDYWASDEDPPGWYRDGHDFEHDFDVYLRTRTN